MKKVWSAHVILEFSYSHKSQNDEEGVLAADLRLRIEFALTQTVVLLAETYDAGGLVHVPRNVPNVEVLRRVHHEELAQAVHEAGAAAEGLLALAAVIVHRAPINLHDWQRACIAPHSDGRGVRIVVYTTDRQAKQLE